MHAAVGVIQPQLFGLELSEILTMERPLYISKVLESYFEIYLSIISTDPNALFINYNDGIWMNFEKLQSFLGLDTEDHIKELMLERTKFHSKHPNQSFSEEAIGTAIPEYQHYIFELYNKLCSLANQH